MELFNFNEFMTCVIFGVPRSGKTTLLKALLHKGIKNNFINHCLFFSSNIYKSDYDFLDMDCKYDATKIESVNALWKYVDFVKGINREQIRTKGLIILDDIAGTHIKLSGENMKNLFMNFRHYGINIIVCNQVIIDVPQYIRSALSYGCIYRYINENDTEKIYEAFGGLCTNKKEFLEKYMKFTDEEFKFMLFTPKSMYKTDGAYCGARAPHPKKIPEFRISF